MSGLNLTATISLDGTQFKRGMEEVGAAAAEGVRNLVIQAVGVATLEEAFRRTVETASELVDESRRLGIPIERLQVLRKAAQDTGTDIQAVTTAMEKLGQAKAMALGQGPSNSLTDTAGHMRFFRELGVSQQLVRTGSADEIFKAVAETIRRAPDPQALIEPLRQVFGRAGGALIPLLQTDLDELGKTMQETGAIMSGDVAAKLKEVADQFSLLKTIVTSSLAPVFLQLSLWGLQLARSFLQAADWIDQRVGVGKFARIIGAVSGQLSAKDFVKFTLEGMAGKSPEALNKEFGIDPKAIKAAVDSPDVFTAWSGGIEKAIQAALDKIAGTTSANYRPLPGGVAAPTAAATMRRGHEGGGGDSLARVGNFLGSSRAALQQTAAHQAAVQTAQNTKLIEQHTAKMAGAFRGQWVGPVQPYDQTKNKSFGGRGDPMDLTFPTN